MKSFKQFLYGLKDKIIGWFKSKINKLGFGNTTKINLSSFSEDVSQGTMGYYSERTTALAIVTLLENNGLDVKFNGKSNATSLAKTEVENYKKKIIKDNIGNKPIWNNNKLTAELKRQELSGEDMGNAIYNDAIKQSDDLALLAFNTKLTGTALSGENKADVVVEIRKKDSGEVVDDIMASLKAYKGWKINLSNNTLVSFFDHLGISNLMSEKEKVMLKTLQDVRANVWRSYKKNDYATLEQQYNKINPNVAKKAKPLFTIEYDSLEYKGKKRKAKNKSTIEENLIIKSAHDVIQGDISEYFVNMFKKYYPKVKEFANNEILTLAGFDGSDDFYLAVAGTKGVKVVSSRVSPQYEKLIKKMQAGFILNVEFKKSAPSVFYITFNTPSNELIVKTSISIGQTASTGLARTNWSFDFKELEPDSFYYEN